MTKEQYMQFHRDCCDKMIAITKAKNADYTGTDASPFANFSRTEMNGICSGEQGFLVRMGDKFARITSFVQKGILEVKDESVEDTLLDLANYCILMAGYIRDKKDQKFADDWEQTGRELAKPRPSGIEITEFYPSGGANVGGNGGSAGEQVGLGLNEAHTPQSGSIDADGTVTP